MARLLMSPVSVALLTLCFLDIASAQSSASGSAPATPSNSAAVTYTVNVGNSHTFQPDVIQARVGDIVKFDFMPLNHSVVRAEFNYPCIPYEKTGAGKVGFFSGFHPVDVILDNPPSWSVRVNDTNPIFFYCSAPGSCINYQMVGVINPNATTPLQTQKDGAKNSRFMLQPGEDFPSESTATPSALTASASTSTSSSSSTSSTAAATASSSHSQKSGLPTGAIAGIVVGAVAVLALAAALMFFVGRSRTLKETVNRQSQAPLTFNPPPEGQMYQTTGFAPMVKPTEFHRNSQVNAYEVPPFDHHNTAYSAGYTTPPHRSGGSPPPQFYAGAAPRQEYR